MKNGKQSARLNIRLSFGKEAIEKMYYTEIENRAGRKQNVLAGVHQKKVAPCSTDLVKPTTPEATERAKP